MNSVYTVGQINAYIRRMFDQDYLLEQVCVQGEVSNCKYHTSGHVYFSLKDETGVLAAVLYARDRANLTFRLENGMQVLCRGNISVYVRDGKYQLYVKRVQQAGVGMLYEQFEALKRKLEAEGLFDPARKKKIPDYIHTLGVVTAPTGAAIRDIIQIARRRNPGIQIILFPAKVQGEGSAQSVAAGIAMLDQLHPDVIIAGRGGGSIEDLWAFNEEIVARSIFSCGTPVISAVGHETDTVISDFVADLRAPTPSAGAELAVGDTGELAARLLHYRGRMHSLMRSSLERESMRISGYRLRMTLYEPSRRLQDLREDHDRRMERLERLMNERLRMEQNRIRLMEEKLARLSPFEKMEQGFALVTDRDGRRIRSANVLREHETVSLTFRDGRAWAAVGKIELSPGNRQERKQEDE